jgi:hypothetical protein
MASMACFGDIFTLVAVLLKNGKTELCYSPLDTERQLSPTASVSIFSTVQHG